MNRLTKEERQYCKGIGIGVSLGLLSLFSMIMLTWWAHFVLVGTVSFAVIKHFAPKTGEPNEQEHRARK